LTEQRRGVEGPGDWAPTGGEVSEENFFEFSSKNTGFYAFLLRKTILVARNRDLEHGGLIDPLGS